MLIDFDESKKPRGELLCGDDENGESYCKIYKNKLLMCDECPGNGKTKQRRLP